MTGNKWLPTIGFLVLIVLSATFSGGPCLGQYPSPLIPPRALPPLLYVKFAGPAGMHVTFYRGGGTGQTAEAPCTVGLRPGYIYRVQMTDIPGHPGLSLFPTLDVRGSLLMANRLRNGDFPAALVFRDLDMAAVREGSLVTRLVVLERPETAIPLASKRDDPLEIDVPPQGDLLTEAYLRGKTLMVVHLGQRQYTPQEMAEQAIPGTLLPPGEKVLPLPRVPPLVAFNCWPIYDPVLGPPDPNEDMKLWDGGDVGLQAGFGPTGNLRGLDPSDTVAEYTNSRGEKRVAVSNRVGLCVPRFVVFRKETQASSQLAQYGPGRATSITSRDLMQMRLPPIEHVHSQQTEAMHGRQRPSGAILMQGTAIIGKLQGTMIYSTALETASIQGRCPPPSADQPDKPLKIIKWPDKTGGLVGDIITFFLRFSNGGGQPITDIVVSDSLTARYEYVPGSARSDRESTFTSQTNDAGSTTLRWEFPGALQPGQTGLISFQVKIR